MLIILKMQTLAVIFKSKQYTVVHAQTTRVQHKTLCLNGSIMPLYTWIWMDKKRYGTFKSIVLNGYLPCTLPQDHISNKMTS